MKRGRNRCMIAVTESDKYRQKDTRIESERDMVKK